MATLLVGLIGQRFVPHGHLVAIIGLMAVMSGALVKEAVEGLCLLAMALVHPQFVHGLFPVPVGGLEMVGGVLLSPASSKY